MYLPLLAVIAVLTAVALVLHHLNKDMRAHHPCRSQARTTITIYRGRSAR